MAQDDTGAGVRPQPSDFDDLYQGGALTLPSEGVRLDVIPWDIQGPQPIIVELEQAGEISSPVLDAGCGLGENALFLAERGYDVTGVDGASAAIEQDRAKARDRGLRVEFVEANVTSMAGVAGQFRTVVDSALLHCLDDEGRRSYLAALHQICEPGARLHVLCFSDAIPRAVPGTSLLTEEALRAAFRTGWTIQRLQRRHYTTALTRQRWLDLADRSGFETADPDAFQVDDKERLLLPIWQVTAERA